MKDKPDLPDAPAFVSDPTAKQAPQDLLALGNRLANFDFTGSLEPLAETISFQPEIVDLALEQATASLQPSFDRNVQDIRNAAASNNQLTSSTFTDALSRELENRNSQLQAITAGAAINSANSALSNRLNLFGTGLNTISGAGQLGLQNQQQVNSFNQSNFENQVGLALANHNSSGGLFGGALGAIGGGLAGLALGGPIGAGLGAFAGGAAGGFGSPGTGGQLLNIGGIIGGPSLLGRPSTRAGQSAGNDRELFSSPFDLSKFQLGGTLGRPGLAGLSGKGGISEF